MEQHKKIKAESNDISTMTNRIYMNSFSVLQ